MTRKSVLKLIREGKGLSRQACAVAIGVDVATWKRWELGMLAPSSRNLLDVAAFLGVPAEQLREITDSKKERQAARPSAHNGNSSGGNLP